MGLKEIQNLSDVKAIISLLRTEQILPSSMVSTKIDDVALSNETESIHLYGSIKESFLALRKTNAIYSETFASVESSVVGKNVQPVRMDPVALHPIDAVLKKHLKAFRKNFCICWKLKDSYCCFDPVSDRLFTCTAEELEDATKA